MSHSTNPAGPVVYGGAEALKQLALHLRGPVDPNLAAHLVWFALPLAARRAADAARFLLEGERADLAERMIRQARVFGEANAHAVAGRWREVGETVAQISSLQTEFCQGLR